jgi:hypothetical protein
LIQSLSIYNNLREVCVPKAKLPIGIQDFEKLISNGYTYVDKTALIYKLASLHDPYFLSRPRRFGKSLLLSTLYALFSGKRHLFKGLWIENSDWDWKEYPIIRLDMSAINNRTPEMFERALIHALNKIASEYGIILTEETSSDYLSELIKQLALATGQKVVVLIDEYDKPLIDNIDNLSIAIENRRILQHFYTILKSQDEYLRFIFLTGVTKFSKISVFSGLNNLNDLTMSNDYSALLGYTYAELSHYFAEEIEEVARANGLLINDCYARIREWYNGYKFSGNGELVFNPFSTLKLINSRQFAAHWFETGTPTFLIKLIQDREFDLIDLERYEISDSGFSSFEIDELITIPLLYQTGYLTIKEYDPTFNRYRLGYPNREVGVAFSERLITYFSTAKAKAEDYLSQIYRNVAAASWDFTDFFSIISGLLALMPYDLYLKNEKHYQSLFFLIIKLAGININAEVHTQRGRADAVLEAKNKIIIFEFKLDHSAMKAVEQIKKNEYYQIFTDRKLPIYLVGINFDSKLRTMSDWHVEQIV